MVDMEKLGTQHEQINPLNDTERISVRRLLDLNTAMSDASYAQNAQALAEAIANANVIATEVLKEGGNVH